MSKFPYIEVEVLYNVCNYEYEPAWFNKVENIRRQHYGKRIGKNEGNTRLFRFSTLAEAKYFTNRVSRLKQTATCSSQSYLSSQDVFLNNLRKNNQ